MELDIIMSVFDENNVEEWKGSIDELIQANEFTDAELVCLTDLKLNESLVVGGGATPLWTIQRVN